MLETLEVVLRQSAQSSLAFHHLVCSLLRKAGDSLEGLMSHQAFEGFLLYEAEVRDERVTQKCFQMPFGSFRSADLSL